MKRIQKVITVLLLLATLCAGAALFAACDSVEKIYVGRNDMPRLTYVEGQDLDFSTGKLTLQYGGGKTETVDLSSPDVTVSDYDKNAVGRQTVKLTYDGMETTIEVMVVARVAAESVQTVYYVGEQNLDTSKGKIRIAKDDGSTFTVSLSDKSLSFSGFDASRAVESQTITVRYQKDGADYTGSFNVRIYGTENAKFTNPVKTSYRSHETLSLSGAQIKFSNGDPKFDKMIAVTEDMVSGADFSKVTEENDADNPLVQHITVNYGGSEFGFDITIIYSNVTRLNKLLATVQYENEKPVLNDENGERLVSCAKLYLEELTRAELSYIEEDSMNDVLCGAAEYVYGKWSADLENYAHSFNVDGEGVVYRLESYEQCKTDVTALSDADTPINAYVKLLQEIAEKDKLQIGEEAIGDYLAPALVYGEEKDKIKEVLTEVTALFEKLKDVPADWTTLTAYQAQIDAVRDSITAEEKEGYREAFRRLSSWREKNDFFDIVYAYYNEIGDQESIAALQNVILPHALEEVFNALMVSLTQYTYISQGVEGENGKKSYVSDSSSMVYYYRKAASYAESVKNGDGLDKTLYGTLKFDGILFNTSTQESIPVTFDELFDFIKTTGYGYYDLLGMALDDPALISVWESYLALMDVSDDAELPAKLNAFFDEFTALSAGRQQAFLLTMNVYYNDYEKPALDTDVSYTFLIRLLSAHYSENFSETEFKMFRNLLLAVENYSRRSDKENAVVDFLANMAEIEKIYEDSSVNTSKFDQEFHEIYEKYAAIAEKYNADGTLKANIQLDEKWQTVFKALQNEITGVMQAYNTLTEEDETKQEQSFIRVLASYEQAKRYVAAIHSDTAPAEVKEAYEVNLYPFGELEWTLDYAFSCQAAPLGMVAYTNLSVADESFWELIEKETAVRDFFAKAVSVVWLSDAEEPLTFTETQKTEIVDVMKAFLDLEPRFKGLFVQLQDMDENHEYYYDGLQTFFASIFKGENAESTKRLCDAAKALTDAEKDYAVYRQLLYYEEQEVPGEEDPEPETPGEGEGEEPEGPQTSEEALALFKTSMEAYNTAYAALSEAERTAFGLLADIYGYYTAEYNRLFPVS